MARGPFADYRVPATRVMPVPNLPVTRFGASYPRRLAARLKAYGLGVIPRRSRPRRHPSAPGGIKRLGGAVATGAGPELDRSAREAWPVTKQVHGRRMLPGGPRPDLLEGQIRGVLRRRLQFGVGARRDCPCKKRPDRLLILCRSLLDLLPEHADLSDPVPQLPLRANGNLLEPGPHSLARSFRCISPPQPGVELEIHRQRARRERSLVASDEHVQSASRSPPVAPRPRPGRRDHALHIVFGDSHRLIPLLARSDRRRNAPDTPGHLGRGRTAAESHHDNRRVALAVRPGLAHTAPCAEGE